MSEPTAFGAEVTGELRDRQSSDPLSGGAPPGGEEQVRSLARDAWDDLLATRYGGATCLLAINANQAAYPSGRLGTCEQYWTRDAAQADGVGSFTVTALRAVSSASARVRPITPCLAAQYAVT